MELPSATPASSKLGRAGSGETREQGRAKLSAVSCRKLSLWTLPQKDLARSVGWVGTSHRRDCSERHAHLELENVTFCGNGVLQMELGTDVRSSWIGEGRRPPSNEKCPYVRKEKFGHPEDKPREDSG